jgi:hypothetical protein
MSRAPCHQWAGHSQEAVTPAYVPWVLGRCSNQDSPAGGNGVECRMSIDRDDGAERQARVDRMIAEFREAQSRRSGKPTDKAVESKPDATTKAPRAGSATSE